MFHHTPANSAASTRQMGGVCTQSVHILLDIGKNVNWVGVYTAAGEELIAPRRLPNTRPGLEAFFALVEQVLATYTPVHVLIGHEPTGIYHEPWAHAILARYADHLEGRATPPFEYRFFNPLQVKREREQYHLRRRKSDTLDIQAMQRLAQQGKGAPPFLPTPADARIRQEVGFIKQQRLLLNTLERQLLRLLDMLWPGAFVVVSRVRQAHPTLPLPTPIVQSRPLQRKRVRALLEHCPNPYVLCAMSDEAVCGFFRTHTGRAGEKLLRTIRAWSEQAILPPPETAETLAIHIQTLFQQYRGVEQSIEDTLSRLVPLIPATPARHLLAIPGLGPMDAAAYLAILGAADRFNTAAEIWAFVGFEPVQDGSGDHPHATATISRRGDTFARNQLFQMGFRVARHYAPVGATFLDAFERSRSKTLATIHAAHRVNRICFALIRDDTPFVNQSTPELEAEVAQRWNRLRQKGRSRRQRRRRRRRR